MKYTYSRRGNHYNVYDPHGHKVEEYYEEEDARKKVYELNGWVYYPKIKQP